MARLGSELLLWLLVPLLQRAAPVPDDICSLRYTFTIPLEPSIGQPWCDVQGQLDADTFLSYNCGNDNVKYISVLVVMVSDTETWKQQIATLRDAGHSFRQQLLDMKKENLIDWGAGSVCLQVMLTCQRNSSGDTNGFWEFGFNGQKSLIFHPENEKWKVVRPGGKSLKEKWEKDREMIPFLKRMSMGDCKKWLEDFWYCQDRNGPSTPSSNPSHEPGLGDLARNSTDVSISEPPTTTSSPSVPTSAIIVIVIVLVLVIVILIIFILFYCCWKKCITLLWDFCPNII
ncbi:UL16-binding protein 3-like [Sorex araneus]|uniref:UL16-binding protein 3-like n=1 Tax=Sorex araneus TaxID=42254 RepID=UPI002433C805|nr:UL16-binding protein 3-like [Sorex araneus]